MSKLKILALAFALATGAFWATMLNDPPKSVAADPSVGLTMKDIKIPASMPFASEANAH
jgi:hypothetical protein